MKSKKPNDMLEEYVQDLLEEAEEFIKNSEKAPNARKIIPYRDNWCWVCRDCGWTSRMNSPYTHAEGTDTDKPSKCPKCGSLNVERFRNKLMIGVNTVMDEKGSFSVEYPHLGAPQEWVLENIGPSSVMFKNNFFPRRKILREKIVLSYSKLPVDIADPWDNTTQGQIGQGFCNWLKKLFRQDFKNLKILSIEKITNPYNNVKGLEFLITLVWKNRPIRAKCLTFIKEQNKYDIIAMAEEREFRMTDLYFFLPVIQNFKF